MCITIIKCITGPGRKTETKKEIKAKKVRGKVLEIKKTNKKKLCIKVVKCITRTGRKKRPINKSGMKKK